MAGVEIETEAKTVIDNFLEFLKSKYTELEESAKVPYDQSFITALQRILSGNNRLINGRLNKVLSVTDRNWNNYADEADLFTHSKQTLLDIQQEGYLIQYVREGVAKKVDVYGRKTLNGLSVVSVEKVNGDNYHIRAFLHKNGEIHRLVVYAEHATMLFDPIELFVTDIVSISYRIAVLVDYILKNLDEIRTRIVSAATRLKFCYQYCTAVIEQNVDIGNAELFIDLNQRLHFSTNTNQILDKNRTEFALVCGTLKTVEDPKEMSEKIYKVIKHLIELQKMMEELPDLTFNGFIRTGETA